jgi:hypothetical protein
VSGRKKITATFKTRILPSGDLTASEHSGSWKVNFLQPGTGPRTLPLPIINARPPVGLVAPPDPPLPRPSWGGRGPGGCGMRVQPWAAGPCVGGAGPS